MTGSMFIATLLAAYGLGSVSFSYFIVKRAKGIDLRTVGSGNLGATNAGRVLGKKWAIIIYLLDGLKGVTAVVGARLLTHGAAFHDCPAQIAAAFGVMLGHIFPFYLGFKGGKGVATGSGVIVALSPITGFATLLTWLATWKASRMVSFGSITAALVLPFLEAYIGRGTPHHAFQTGFFGFVGALVIVMHRKNIQRILAGVEPKSGAKK